MKKVASLLVGLVACLHLLFLVLEMFLWQTPYGLTIFKMTPEMASQTAILAKNQGLYNGILAAGLFWTYFIEEFKFQQSARTFFLVGIIAVGIFGAATAKFSILYIQAFPAFIALIAVTMSKK